MIAAGPWVLASERLPELLPLEPKREVRWSVPVLVWGRRDGIGVARRWVINEDPIIDHWETSDGDSHDVTHWAPIHAPEVTP